MKKIKYLSAFAFVVAASLTDVTIENGIVTEIFMGRYE